MDITCSPRRGYRIKVAWISMCAWTSHAIEGNPGWCSCFLDKGGEVWMVQGLFIQDAGSKSQIDAQRSGSFTLLGLKPVVIRWVLFNVRNLRLNIRSIRRVEMISKRLHNCGRLGCRLV